MEIYLDNSATTRVLDSVKDEVINAMQNDYGNPSSLHLKGVSAENHIKKAKEIIAKNLKVNDKEIIFTSGGTESNNLSIIGIANAYKRRGNHIITTKIEHPSVINAMKYLEDEGYEITYLDVNREGRISVEDLKNNITDKTILVSIMHVNNEIGSIMPIEEVGLFLKKEYPEVIFHVDGIQSFGKFKINPKKIGVDALSVSGHKIHAIKGIGFIYLSEKVKIKPILFGGGQQKNIRPGTENVPGIAAIGMATFEAYSGFEEKTSKIGALKKLLIEGLSDIQNIKINSLDTNEFAPHILNISFVGVRSEVMLHSLEDRGIYVSSGSACSSNKSGLSNTLKCIKLKEDEQDSAIRISLSAYNTEDEVEYTIKTIKELIDRLRLFVRKK